MPKNAVITLGDRLYIEVRNQEYCDEAFGVDYFEDFAVEIPEELLERIVKNEKEFQELQKQLKPFYDKTRT
jgi:hypothetical protein